MSDKLKKAIKDIIWVIERGGSSISKTTLNKIEESLIKIRDEYDPNDPERFYEPDVEDMYQEEPSTTDQEEVDQSTHDKLKSQIAKIKDPAEKAKAEQMLERYYHLRPTSKTSAKQKPAVKSPVTDNTKNKNTIENIVQEKKAPSIEYSMEDPSTLETIKQYAGNQLGKLRHEEGRTADPKVNPIKAIHSHSVDTANKMSHHDLGAALDEYRGSKEYKDLPHKDRVKAEVAFRKKWRTDNADAVNQDKTLLQQHQQYANAANLANKKHHIDITHDLSMGGGVGADESISPAEAAELMGTTKESDDNYSSISSQLAPTQKITQKAPELIGHAKTKLEELKDPNKRKKVMDIYSKYEEVEPHLQQRADQVSKEKEASQAAMKEKYNKAAIGESTIEKQDPAIDWFHQQHAGLAHKAVNTYKDQAAAAGISEEDLHDSAHKGLLAAANTFDPSRNTKFSTHAMNTMKGHIRQHLEREGYKDIPSNIKRKAQILSSNKAANRAGEVTHTKKTGEE